MYAESDLTLSLADGIASELTGSGDQSTQKNHTQVGYMGTKINNYRMCGVSEDTLLGQIC